MDKDKANQIEKMLWSVALPGFGQLLNKKYFKGLVLIILELTINYKSNLNEAIIYSFYGEIQLAIETTNYQWLMFYPCVYLFSIWDAYRDAGAGKDGLLYLPFVFAAYFGTIGVIYSPTFSIAGTLFGPIFLPIIFFILGIFVGLLIRRLLLRIANNE